MNDGHVAALLDDVVPDYDDRSGNWEAVLHDARQRRRWPLRAGLGFAVAAAAAVTVLAWPFQAQQGGVLERALAAIGDGPVLHVVLRGEWGGTLVNLSNGERTPVYGENEVWFDTRSGQAHTIERLGDVVQGEDVGTPRKPSAELAALGREYRQALVHGNARIAGEDQIDGEPVVWITVHSEVLPDVADGKDHEWAQQIAVSRQTYKPLAIRETRDGKPGSGTLQRVLELQMIPRSDADFIPSRPSRNGTAFRQSRYPVPVEQAPNVLGQAPLWLGTAYDGLPLAQVYKEATSVGEQRRVRLTGAEEAAAIECSERRGQDAGECFRSLGLGSVEVRPDGVFTTTGPMRWTDASTAIVLFYGSVGDDPSTYRDDQVPRHDSPYVTVTESTEPSPFRRGVGSYVPPEGSVLLTAGARTGVLQVGGVHVSIEAPDEEAVLAAARSLHPMPN